VRPRRSLLGSGAAHLFGRGPGPVVDLAAPRVEIVAQLSGLRLCTSACLVELAAEILGRIDVGLDCHRRHGPAAEEVRDERHETCKHQQPSEHAPMLQCPAELLATPCANPPGTGAEG
jgi:hypothetical protein